MISYLQVTDLSKSFGERTLFSGLTFALGEGRRTGLIARNGTGKSTLLDIIAGRGEADRGEVVFRRDLTVAYLPQSPVLSPGTTVLEACFSSRNELSEAIAAYERALSGGNAAELERAINRMDASGAWDYEERCKQILQRLDITDFGQRVETLSGGQAKRVALAGVLITQPDLLILDEPTNHLDPEMTAWLETWLAKSKCTLLMVTHDRYFLDRVCNDIIEIDNGRLYRYAGNYSYSLEKRSERLAAEAARRESDENLYRRELEWIRSTPQARSSKAQYRIDAFHELKERLNGGTSSEADVRLEAAETYLGKKIFVLHGVSKRYGDKVLLSGFDYTFARYERLGIAGANGTGKSTFVKMLLGLVEPDAGTIERGQTLRIGYYSQQGMEFDENMRVIDAVSSIAEQIDTADGRRITASQLLTRFLFPPAQQYDRVAKLSGGERRRLYLCTVLMRNPNLLILDEPTNDLDIMTLNFGS